MMHRQKKRPGLILSRTLCLLATVLVLAQITGCAAALKLLPGKTLSEHREPTGRTRGGVVVLPEQVRILDPVLNEGTLAFVVVGSGQCAAQIEEKVIQEKASSSALASNIVLGVEGTAGSLGVAGLIQAATSKPMSEGALSAYGFGLVALGTFLVDGAINLFVGKPEPVKTWLDWRDSGTANCPTDRPVKAGWQLQVSGRSVRAASDINGRVSVPLDKKMEALASGNWSLFLAGSRSAMADFRIEESGFPRLVVDASLVDENGDGLLSAGDETVRLRVSVRNEGKAAARGVAVLLQPKKVPKGLKRLHKKLEIGYVARGETRTVTIPIQASRTSPGGKFVFDVQVTEARKALWPEAVRADLTVQPFYPPKLKIKVAYDRDRVVPGEQVVMTVFVQNTGKGKARNVSLAILPANAQLVQDQILLMIGSKSGAVRADLGPLDPGRYATKTLSFLVGRQYKGKTLDFVVSASETRASQKISHTEAITLGQYVPTVQTATLKGTVKQDSPNEPLPMLLGNSDVDIWLRKMPVPQNPDPRKLAVVVGIQSYRKAAAVPFARTDAAAMQAFFEKVVGIPSSQIITLVDDKATLSALYDLLDTLPARTEGMDEVYFYYAGHGLAEPGSGVPYLIPQDGVPDNLMRTGIQEADLIRVLESLPVQKVTLFMDSCFSGSVRGQAKQTLLASARPGTLMVKKATRRLTKTSVLTAVTGEQIAGIKADAGHGLFTYYLLDAWRQGKDNLRSAFDYLKGKVSQESRAAGATRAQTPELVEPEGS